MSRINLDLKNFKHVKSDDKSTTLQHKDGHKLTLAHNVLSKVAQQQLEALSRVATDAQTPADKDEAKHKGTAAEPKSREDKGFGAVQVKEAEGGEISGKKPKYCAYCGEMAHGGECASPKMYAKGATVTKDDIPTELPDKTTKADEQDYNAPSFKDWSPPLEVPNSIAKIPESDPLNISGDVGKATEGALPVPDASDTAPEPQADFKSWSAPGTVPARAPQAEAAPNVAGAQQETQAGMPPAQPDASQPQAGGLQVPNPQDAEGMLMGGYNQRLAGINAQAQAQGNLGAEQAEKLDKTVEAQRQAADAYKDHFKELENERQAFMKDIQAGHIDPNKYWTGDENGNGGHSKIAAAIGMLIAGFNPTTNHAAPMDFIKGQMEMNLRAQERNLGSKENLLKANLQQFGNLKDATDMTRIMQHDIVANELSAAAAKAQTPMAKALAMDAAGKLKMETAPMVQQFAMRRAMMSLANNGSNPQALDQMVGYLRATNPEMAKEIESRYVPGVGLGKVPIPEGVRQELVAKADLQNTAQNTLHYAETHTNLNPMSAEYTKGVQMASILQQKIREGMLGTVFRESEKPLLKQFVDSQPANAFKMITTVPKLKTLLESNAQSTNVLKRMYGLPVTESQMDNEPKKGIDGRMYKKSADGKYMIPVSLGK